MPKAAVESWVLDWIAVAGAVVVLAFAALAVLLIVAKLAIGMLHWFRFRAELNEAWGVTWPDYARYCFSEWCMAWIRLADALAILLTLGLWRPYFHMRILRRQFLREIENHPDSPSTVP